MSYVETLRNRRKTPTSTWHKLRTSIATRKFDFYVAFEGEEDEEFYSVFLAERFPDRKFRPMICDGKGGVLALHDEVVKQYGGPRNVFFFVDSDHDRFLGQDKYPSQTFSTCGYSVENYIYDPEVILAGIRKHFRLNPADKLCHEIEKAFEKDRCVFEARARSVMSYAIALRASDQNPILKNVRFGSIFKLEENGLIRKKINCSTLLEAADAEPLPMTEVIRRARMHRSTHPNIIFRGKLVAQFVVNFCMGLTKRFEASPKLNGKPLKAKIELNKKNFVSIFVEFVTLPQRLSEFFKEMDNVLVCSGR